MSRVLVTGATGHIGSHIVRALLDDGHEVVVFHRASSDRTALQGLPLTARYGDLIDARAVERAVDGCELVFHVGAVHRNWAPQQRDFVEPNVSGTRNVLRAAKAAGVRRVVVTSSQATIGYTADPQRPLDETSHNQTLHMDYVRSKVEAEALALRLGASEGLEVVVVNPTATLGPLDYRCTPTNQGVRGMLSGGPVLFGINVADVRDVARGHLLAAERGEPGERYILGGDNLLRLELAELVARLTRGRPNRVMPPHAVLSVFARVMPVVARLRKQDADISPEALQTMWGRHMLYDTRKAREALGYQSRSASETLLSTMQWHAFMGWLAPKVRRRVADQLEPDPEWTPPSRR